MLSKIPGKSPQEIRDNLQFSFRIAGNQIPMEREAMKTRSKELAAEQRANKKKGDGEKDVLTAIAAMTGSDKSMAKRVHELVTQTAPELLPKT